MDGLQGKYAAQIAFLSIDVSTSDGQLAFKAAQLAGHPSFLILKSDGTELWRAVGQQTGQALVAGLENALHQASATANK